jgi:acyl-coenzyme A thioesterase 7
MSSYWTIPASIAIGTTAYLLLLTRRSQSLQSSPKSADEPKKTSSTTTSEEYVTTLTRLMLPDDANPAGNVHGGTILKMIEMSAYILANRHGNMNTDLPTGAILAGIKSTSFLKPMHVGDICHLQVKIIATYNSSMEIAVRVYREDIRNGKEDLILTNEANLWYVRVALSSKQDKSASVNRNKTFNAVPGILNITPTIKEEAEAAKRRYQENQNARKKNGTEGTFDPLVDPNDIIIAQLILPSDCTKHGLVFGGVLAKAMDSAAGVTAYKLCRTNCVTVSMNDFVLISPCVVGDYIRVRTRIIFTSSKTAELEAICTRPSKKIGEECCCRAFFTFVALDNEGKVTNMPKFLPKTERQQILYREAKERYERKKSERLSLKNRTK